MWFGKEHFELQFVPPVLGLVWGCLYWRRCRHNWRWDQELPLILLVSVLTAAYGAWPFDLVVLLLPVIEVAARAQHVSRAQLAIIAGVYAAIEVPALALSVAGVDPFYFVWMPPALLLSYLGLRMVMQGSANLPAPDDRGSESSSLARVS